MGDKYLNYLNYLKEMLGKDAKKMPQLVIVENHLLPKFVGVLGTNQRQRGYVSDEFMDFLVNWGQYCFELEKKSACAMMLIGMQRVLHGGVFYDRYLTQCRLHRLPEKYSNYAAWADKNMPMNKVCWQFLQTNLEFCLNQGETLNEISSAILRCLLRNLNENGQVSAAAPDYVWDEEEIGISVRNAYLWALDLALRHYGLKWCIRAHAPLWHEKLFFFRKYRQEIIWRRAMKYFPLDNERYYTGGIRLILKETRLYDIFTMWRIKKEIFAA